MRASEHETINHATRSQLSLAKKHHLPLFLHSRAAHEDFRTILQEEGFGADGGRSAGARGGVVHSFTGTIREMNDLVRHWSSRLVSLYSIPSTGRNGLPHRVRPFPFPLLVMSDIDHSTVG